MRFTSSALAKALLVVSSTTTSRAFLPQDLAAATASSSRSSPLMAVSIDADAPERVAPDAGWNPEWEDRPGLTEEVFLKSDESKPDLSGMWECPLTRWDAAG